MYLFIYHKQLAISAKNSESFMDAHVHRIPNSPHKVTDVLFTDSNYSQYLHSFCTALKKKTINPLNPELNPVCYLLALLAHHFLHVSRIRVKLLTFRLLMSYIHMEHPFLMFLDHTQRRSTVGRTPLDE